MKKRNRIFAGCLAMLIICCTCSAGADMGQHKSGTTMSNTNAVIPTARQGGDSGFTDIAPGAWYAEAANWCRMQGILDGDTFSPDMEMTRAAVSEALYRAEGSPETAPSDFPDAPADSPYANAAALASANGVMFGYTNGLFGADGPVTREQMAAILWRCAGEPAAETGQDFVDEASIAGSAQTAVDWARANGVVNGKDGNLFDPKGTLTRAQTAAILYRYLTGVKSAAGNGSVPVVYMTTDISSKGMMAIYEALNWTHGENVAVKLSTGEPPASNYLRPELIQDVVQMIDGSCFLISVLRKSNCHVGRPGPRLKNSCGHSDLKAVPILGTVSGHIDLNEVISAAKGFKEFVKKPAV